MMRAARRPTGACLTLAVLFVVEAIGFARAQTPAPPSRRAQLSPERATRMEALLLKMFPGAALDWNSERLVYPDGRRQFFSFGIYEERLQPGERSTFLIASPKPEERHGKAAAFAIRNDRGASGGGQWLFYGLNERGDQPRWQVRLPCKSGSCKAEPEAILGAASQSAAWK